MKTQFWPLMGYLTPKKSAFLESLDSEIVKPPSRIFFGRFEVGFGAPPKRQKFSASEKKGGFRRGGGFTPNRSVSLSCLFGTSERSCCSAMPAALHFTWWRLRRHHYQRRLRRHHFFASGACGAQFFWIFPRASWVSSEIF